MKLVMGLVVCLFMGILVISVGLGAAFPAINQIARPFVCPTGTMNMKSRVFNPYPGKVVTSQTWYCVNEQDQTETQLSMFQIAPISGGIYGMILFALLAVRGMLRR